MMGGSCRRYNHPDIIITENGVCLPGEADAALPGVLNDVKRIEFLRDYVQAAMQAVKVDKVCVRCPVHACVPPMHQAAPYLWQALAGQGPGILYMERLRQLGMGNGILGFLRHRPREYYR